MKLFHGTNGDWVKSIIRNGIEPRRRTAARNNWKHVPHQSNPQCVYLTDSYAPYFANNASRGSAPQCAVVEIDTKLLDTNTLRYDEDAWEQLGRHRDHISGTPSERTLWYRGKQNDRFVRNLFVNAAGDPDWLVSLKSLGTCCHWGTIPEKAITRIISWPNTHSNQMLNLVWDPSITLINQRLCGPRYRALTAKLFNDPVPPLPLSEKVLINFALDNATYYTRGSDEQWRQQDYAVAWDETLAAEKAKVFGMINVQAMQISETPNEQAP